MNQSLRRWMLLISFALLAAGHLLLSAGGLPLWADDARPESSKDAAPAGESAPGTAPTTPPGTAAPPAIPGAPGGVPSTAAGVPVAPRTAAPPMIVRSGAIALPAGGKIAIIPVEGTIYGFTVESLKRRVDRAVAAGSDIIIFEMNTNGGMLDSALEISKFIRAQIERPDRTRIPTIAWVNDKAYSAGILISSAAGHIIMSPAAATGDCAPISALGNTLGPTERAKALSPLLTEFQSNAEENNYSYAIYHAMCVLGVKLYLVEHKSELDPVSGSPRRTIVNQIDYQIMVDGKSRTSLADEVAKVFGGGGEGIEQVGAAKRDVATDADRGQWKLVEEIHDGTTLLTLSTSQAVKIGLALPGTFARDADIEQYFAASQVYRINETWSETMAGFLVSMPVRAVLVIIFLVCFVAEMMAPGMSVFGVIAGCAIVLLIVSPLLVGLAEVWHILLFFVGFLLLMAEIFVTPGFGVLGISGMIAMLGGIILAVVPTSGGGAVPLPAPEMMVTLQQSALWTMVGLIGGLAGMFVLVRYYGELPLFKHMILHAEQKAIVQTHGGTASDGSRLEEDEAGNRSEENPGEHPSIVAAKKMLAGDDALGRNLRVGNEGRTTTELRPMGKAAFGEQVVDVQSTGDWVESGRPVRIVKMIGSRVIVESAT